ncbi:MAG: ACP S-malonyltransferase [Clostridia bacterium]|nr:ACP S-malonyltransferase [Clostridia bacterium]
MKIGFLFPGQGAQAIGMGKDLYDKYEIVKNTYERVKQLTGIDVAEITFNSDEQILNETQNTQIAILTMSLAIVEILKENGIKAEISAGLSLGEYSALIYSNAISFEEGVKLVQKRGEYMQNLVPAGEWSMSAIIGMNDEQVEEVCKQVKSGFVVPVNFNCPGQIVVSGEKEAVEEAAVKAKEAGAKMAKVLKTSGPFHTEKLIKAAEALKQDLLQVEINNFESKVVKNLDGQIYTQKDNVQEILEKHMTSPVRFSNGLQTMLDNGIDTFIEIGPGKTLSGFVKRMKTDKQINILNINNVETLENTINFIKEGNE